MTAQIHAPRPIQTRQIKIIQTICSKRFEDRDERLDFISNFFGQDVRSTKDLTQVQADDLIFFLQKNKAPNDFAWGKFDKQNKQHRTVLSRCLQLGWSSPDKPQFADLNRLGAWLKSKRSPVQLPLKEMTPRQLSKIISALENMQKKHYK